MPDKNSESSLNKFLKKSQNASNPTTKLAKLSPNQHYLPK